MPWATLRGVFSQGRMNSDRWVRAYAHLLVDELRVVEDQPGALPVGRRAESLVDDERHAREDPLRHRVVRALQRVRARRLHGVDARRAIDAAGANRVVEPLDDGAGERPAADLDEHRVEPAPAPRPGRPAAETR